MGEDLGLERLVDAEWNRIKKDVKRRVDANKAQFGGGIADRYVEVCKMEIKYKKQKKEGKFDMAFYSLHLYLACVLAASLHKPQPTGPSYEKQAKDVMDMVNMLQSEMNFCMEGVKGQLRVLFKNQIAADLPSAPPAATAVAMAAPIVPQPKRPTSYTAEQARSALDALRIDGRPTNVNLYGMDIGPPSAPAPQARPPPAAVSAPAPATPIQPPPSYASVKKPAQYLNVRRVMGDGNCAFRAIAQGRANGSLNPQMELQRALELRRTATQELQRRAGEEMTGTGLTVEQLVLMKDTKFPTYNEYIRAMSKSEHAGETEFLLLSERLGINIAIYTPEGGSYSHLITYGKANSEAIKLLWQRGKVSEAGNHYDLLL
uniref:OTU domain-containing protein n=1 Tax=Mucochytrium quahogii TaxID=96639 RepID=A0A7S2RU33_9STRA|mmetsp:Transcript_2010/g.4067  ORF Transcript_2010/g.4067 Transcript_2010/m.4067 type:complete len:374 (+) Transcript_2010:278-1399(+)